MSNISYNAKAFARHSEQQSIANARAKLNAHHKAIYRADRLLVLAWAVVVALGLSAPTIARIISHAFM